MKYVIFSIFSLLGLLINNLIITRDYMVEVPIFTVSPICYRICSTGIYILTTFALFLSFKPYLEEKFPKRLTTITMINLLLYTSYNLFTFLVISPLLSFAFKTFQFIATLYLNEEIYAENKMSVKLLVFYILWTFYLMLSSISVFFLNNS